MAQMVFGKQEPLFPFYGTLNGFQLANQKRFLEQLFLDPDRQRLPERSETPWREREVGFQEPLELYERFVVERDVIDILRREANLLQTSNDRIAGKVRIVLLTGEAFFLGRSNDLSVGNDRGGAVVVVG